MRDELNVVITYATFIPMLDEVEQEAFPDGQPFFFALQKRCLLRVVKLFVEVWRQEVRLLQGYHLYWRLGLSHEGLRFGLRRWLRCGLG